MTDVLEEIRIVVANAKDDPDFYSELLGRAADEIERLRAKIEAISQVAGKASIEGVTFAQIKGRDSEVLGKFTGDEMMLCTPEQADIAAARVLNNGK